MWLLLLLCLQVSLEQYLSAPSDYITQVPSKSELPAAEPKVARTFETPASSGSSYSASSRQGGGKSGMGPGEIAGIIVGAVAGVGILGALAYFVGYKKLYKTHKATSYKRGEIPDGPSKSNLCIRGFGGLSSSSCCMLPAGQGI